MKRWNYFICIVIKRLILLRDVIMIKNKSKRGMLIWTPFSAWSTCVSVCSLGLKSVFSILVGCVHQARFEFPNAFRKICNEIKFVAPFHYHLTKSCFVDITRTNFSHHEKNSSQTRFCLQKMTSIKYYNDAGGTWIRICSWNYHQISNISRTKSKQWTVSRLVFQLPWPNPLKPDVKSRMKM